MKISNFFQQPFELIPEVFLVTNEDYIIIEMNSYVEEFLNLTRNELIGKPIVGYILLQDMQILENIQSLNENETFSFEDILFVTEEQIKVFIKVKMIIKNDRKYYSWMILDYSNEQNETQAMIDFMAELNSTKSKLIKYTNRIEIFKTIINQISQGILISNSKDKVVFINDYAKKIFSFENNNITVSDIMSCISHFENMKYETILDYAKLNSIKDQVIIQNRSIEKETRYYLTIFKIDQLEQHIGEFNLIWNFFEFDEETDMRQLFIDFSAELTIINRELEEKNSAILKLAREDGLTNLYNRRYMNEIIETELKKAQSYGQNLSLIISDIDDFKKFNDIHGHLYGDFIIKTVASITQIISENFGYTGRYGGEEFIVLLPNYNINFSQGLAEDIRQKIQNKIIIRNGIESKVTVSFGVSTFRDGDTVDSLINRADKALYMAKSSGKNQVIIEDN